MATKNSKTKTAAAEAEDLLGGTPASDDLLGGSAPTTTKPKASKPAAKAATKPAAKAAKPAAKAAKAEPAAKLVKAAKAPKAVAEAVERGAKGTGKFYIDPAELAALQKKIASQKKPASSKELADKFETETWKARTAAAALAKEGKGSLAKVGSTLVYTPA